MIIDGGSSSNSSLIYSFLKNNGIDHLDYVVATNPDDEHVGGLSGALNYASADMAFNPYDKRDKLVIQCIKNGQYNIFEVNAMLHVCGLTPLGN